MRLGRGDRLDRRRRGLLQPRRPDRPDHHAAHPAAVRGRPRGSRDAVGRADRRRPSSAGWTMPREASSRMADRPSPCSARAGWARAMAERLASRGVDGRRLQPVTASRPRRWPSGSGRRVAATPAEAAAAADVTISMVADDDAVRALFDGPDGVAAGIRAGSVAVDCSTVLPDAIRSVAGAVRARDAGHPRRARVGQRQLDPRRGADDHGRRRGGRPRRAHGRSSITSRDGSSTSGRSGPARR